jgi:tRNA nucleotidyltransferase (CCA-adding enzyme)
MDVITTHINADFDSLASMLAAKKLYPDGVLVFPGSQERSLRDFFIHSTLYALEVERMKNIDLRKVRRLILVDTRQLSRIGKFSELIGKPGIEIHIYDHHPPSSEDIRGDFEMIAEVGATVTLLVRLLEERSIEITADEATAMILGLYEDTGNLTFPSTKEEDFKAAAFLVRKGANLNIISDVITRELTAEQVFLLNDLIRSATRYSIQGIDVVIAHASADRYVGDIAVLVHKMLDMENLNALFVLVLMENRIYLIGRSRIEEINCAEIAAEFGGGGHPTAASATIKEMGLAEAQARLVKVLQETVRPKRTARDVMVYPVKSLEPDQSLEEAEAILARYNVSTLPVVREGKVVGLISKQVVDRAIHHGLHRSPVREYMSTEFLSVSPDEGFRRVQEIVIGQNQPLLPVIEKGELRGTISVADVVRELQEEMLKSPNGPLALGEQPLYARKRMIAKLMEERLPPRIFNLLRELGQVGDEVGYSVYVVGGFVRDLLMGVENFDLDIVVEGDGIQFAEAVEQKMVCRIRSHKKFGTAVILFPDRLKVDVATARIEYYDSPAALPTVERGSIKMDLYRRDFTINTLAVQLNDRTFGELIDFFGGVKDIKDKVIRVLHNLSFVEDPTRVFRAIRFEQRLGFYIAKHTQGLMKNAVKTGFMERLSGGRIFSEVVLILQEDNPAPTLRRMKDFDLLRFLHPSIRFDAEAEALFERIHHVLSWFDLLFLEERYERWLIYFYGLIDSLKPAEIEALCEHLALNPKQRRRVIDGRRRADQVLLEFYSWIQKGLEPKRSEIFAILHPLSTEEKLFMMAKTTQKPTRRFISLYFTQLKDVKPLLKGADVIEMGVRPGPAVRKILSDLLKARMDGLLTTRQDEVEFVGRRQQSG